MISTNFVFDGVNSEVKGLYLVRNSNGMFPLPYVSGRDIKEDYPSKARAPYFFNIQHQQPTITLAFSTLTNDMNSNKLSELASWLFQDEYKEFYSEDNPDKIYYLMASNEINFMTNGNNEGYFEVQFKSKFPYALTQEEEIVIDLSTNTSSTTVKLYNKDNVHKYYYPEIEISVVSAAPSVITFTNTSDTNRLTSFGGYVAGEIIYANNDRKQIISNLGTYLYDDFNKNWLRLVQGDNKISITGKCVVTFRMQFPVFT